MPTRQISSSRYNIETCGAVIAIRIYYEPGTTKSMAEIKMACNLATEVICWDCKEERDMFMKGVTSYTLFYDERKKRPFSSW